MDCAFSVFKTKKHYKINWKAQNILKQCQSTVLVKSNRACDIKINRQVLRDVFMRETLFIKLFILSRTSGKFPQKIQWAFYQKKAISDYSHFWQAYRNILRLDICSWKENSQFNDRDHPKSFNFYEKHLQFENGINIISSTPELKHSSVK